MTNPNVSITKAGQSPAMTIDRLMARIDRIKLAMAKPTVNPEKRALLEQELNMLMDKIKV